MIFKKKFFFIFLFIFFYSGVCFSNPEIDKVILDLEKTYLEATYWQTEFKQSTYVPLLDKSVEKMGMMYLSKPGKIKITYQNPLKKDYICDGKKLWIYTHGDSIAIKTDQIDEVMSLESFRFLTGASKLRDEFSFSKRELSSNKKYLNLVLIPKSIDSIFLQVKLDYNIIDKRIEKLELFNVSGNKTEFNFSKTKFNQSFDKDLFKFKKPKGVKIVKG